MPVAAIHVTGNWTLTTPCGSQTVISPRENALWRQDGAERLDAELLDCEEELPDDDDCDDCDEGPDDEGAVDCDEWLTLDPQPDPLLRCDDLLLCELREDLDEELELLDWDELDDEELELLDLEELLDGAELLDDDELELDPDVTWQRLFVHG